MIRNQKSKIHLEHHISYDKRYDQIMGSDICDEDDCYDLELCVMSKNSNGVINGWFDSQCVYLPSDFDDIKRKYSSRNHQIYILHSIKKNVRARTAAHPSGRHTKANKQPAIQSNAIIAIFIVSLVFINQLIAFV